MEKEINNNDLNQYKTSIINEEKQKSEIKVPFSVPSFITTFNKQDVFFKKTFELSNSFNINPIAASYNINDLLISQKTEKNIDEVFGVLETKNGLLENDFISSISNFQLNYNTISDKGINVVNSFNEHTGRINDFEIIQEHSAFVSVSTDGHIKIWDLRGSNKSVKTFKPEKPVWSCSVFGEYLCAGIEKDVVVWSLKTMKPYAKINFLHSEAILCLNIKFVEGKPYLISSGDDGLINVLDISTSKISTDNIVSTLNANQTIASVDLLNNSLNFVKASTSTEVFTIYNLENNAEVMSFDAKQAEIDTDYIINTSTLDESTNKMNVKLGNFK